MPGARCRVSEAGCGVPGARCRLSEAGVGCRVLGVGCLRPGVGCRVFGVGCLLSVGWLWRGWDEGFGVGCVGECGACCVWGVVGGGCAGAGFDS
ncbi:hypothetical protein CG747_46195 [Streptomyces sp. CB02959]|nr:hypothetical protein CG747_46195 [Streptomyces sp. CB02959]